MANGTSVSFGASFGPKLNLFNSDWGFGIQNGVLYTRGGAFTWFRGGVHNDNTYNPGAGGTEIMRLDPGGNLRTLTGTIAALSDRDAKTDLRTVNPQEVLARVAALPISTWRFKTAEAAQRHIGPMAQDFYAAFNVGLDEKSICTVDADGVALAAIQGLNDKVEVRSQRSDVRIQKLETENAALRIHNESLEQRLDALERIIRHQEAN